MTEKTQFMDRAEILSANLNMPVFILENPITGVLQGFIGIQSWRVGNVNVNNYNELIAKDITYYLTSAWTSLSPNNAFNVMIAQTTIDPIPTTSIQFSVNWHKWLWLK